LRAKAALAENDQPAYRRCTACPFCAHGTCGRRCLGPATASTSC